jgi:hypothetical protein
MSAIKFAEAQNIKLRHQGIGVVVEQSVSAGSPLSDEISIELRYAPPRYE